MRKFSLMLVSLAATMFVLATGYSIRLDIRRNNSWAGGGGPIKKVVKKQAKKVNPRKKPAVPSTRRAAVIVVRKTLTTKKAIAKSPTTRKATVKKYPWKRQAFKVPGATFKLRFNWLAARTVKKMLGERVIYMMLASLSQYGRKYGTFYKAWKIFLRATRVDLEEKSVKPKKMWSYQFLGTYMLPHFRRFARNPKNLKRAYCEFRAYALKTSKKLKITSDLIIALTNDLPMFTNSLPVWKARVLRKMKELELKCNGYGLKNGHRKRVRDPYCKKKDDLFKRHITYVGHRTAAGQYRKISYKEWDVYGLVWRRYDDYGKQVGEKVIATIGHAMRDFIARLRGKPLRVDICACPTTQLKPKVWK